MKMNQLAEALFVLGVIAITYGMFQIHSSVGWTFSGIAVIAFSALLNWKPRE